MQSACLSLNLCPATYCMVMGKLFSFSVPSFPHLFKMGSYNSTYFTKLLCELNVIIHVKGPNSAWYILASTQQIMTISFPACKLLLCSEGNNCPHHSFVTQKIRFILLLKLHHQLLYLPLQQNRFFSIP